MVVGTSLAVLLNAAASLYARATAPRTPPVIHVAAPSPPGGAARDAALDDLVAAYPQALAGHRAGTLLWRSGPPTPIGTARRDAEAAVATPAIADIFAWPYPLGEEIPAPLGDPGRARPAAFFTRLYGDCAKGEVEPQLVDVRWVGGRSLRFTRVAGAAEALEAVARDLETLGPAFDRYLWPTSGTYNCRAIAGTASKSMHAYGAAIDLAARFGAYWRWGPRPAAARAIPWPIIAAFERHGFIWGGKWAHFDSFHFEYRPELIRAARRKAGHAD